MQLAIYFKEEKMLNIYCSNIHHKTCFPKFSFLFFVLFCFLIANYSAWANEAQQEFPLKIGFIAFDHGDYDLKHLDEVERVFNQLQSFSDTTSLHLIGHSHSKADQASKKLALMRAEIVRDELINLGFEAAPIRIDHDVQNLVSSDTLLNGVSVLISSETETVAMVIQPDPSIVPLQNISFEQSYTNTQPESDICSLVNMQVGSLRTNLEREISDCGYIMGRWRFGDGDEVIDWHIPVAYSIVVDDSLVGLLQLIERNYQIRAHIHELDDSIDFFPTIRDRGNRNQ